MKKRRKRCGLIAAILLFCVHFPVRGDEAAESWVSRLDSTLSFGYPLGPGIGLEFHTMRNHRLVFGARAAMTPVSYTVIFPRNLSDDGIYMDDYRTMDCEWGILAGYLLNPSPVWEALFDLSFGGHINYRSAYYIDENLDINAEYAKLSWLPELRVTVTGSLSPAALFHRPGDRGFRMGLRLGIPFREPSYIYARCECTAFISWRWGMIRSPR